MNIRNLKISIIWALTIGQAPLYAVPSLLKKRDNHTTVIVDKKRDDELPPKPEGDIFDLIKFPSKMGELSAYLTKVKKTEKPSPAIIWLTGGFPVSSSGASLWGEASASNEQSARIYRLKGVAMMFPHLRGRAGNPGHIENFYGEVDDVISAFEYLSKLEYIDPKRIYLGGHSSGGTLALLVAASTEKFAGVISLGPVDTDYGKDRAVYKWDKKERELRHPILHLDSIKSPTFVTEGEKGNFESLKNLKKANTNPIVRIFSVDQADHFNVIHPFNTLIADAILKSKDGSLNLSIPKLKACYVDYQTQHREASDLETLSKIRSRGIDITKPQSVTFYFFSEQELHKSIKTLIKSKGFVLTQSEEIKGKDNSVYYGHHLTKTMPLNNLEMLFTTSSQAEALAGQSDDFHYDSWNVE